MLSVNQHVPINKWLGLDVAYAVVRMIHSPSCDYVVEIFAPGDKSVWTGTIQFTVLNSMVPSA